MLLAELGLKQVRMVEGKLEAAPSPGRIASPVDRMMSRATVPPELAARAAKHLRPGGELALSGGAGAPSLEELSAFRLVHQEGRVFSLPRCEGRVLDRLRRG